MRAWWDPMWLLHRGAISKSGSTLHTNNLRIIKDLMECSLPTSVTVRIIYRDTTYTAAGWANLGPTLQRSTGLTSAEQESVSACLLARVNASGTSVQIDLLGPFTGLNTATQ